MQGYSNLSELKLRLADLNLLVDPFTLSGYTHIIGSSGMQVISLILTSPERFTRYAYYPRSLQILINSIIMISRSHYLGITHENSDKIDWISDDRLSSPEIFVPSLEVDEINPLDYSSDRDSLYKLCCDTLSCEIDQALEESDSYGKYLEKLIVDPDRNKLISMIMSEALEPNIYYNLLSPNSPYKYEVGFGIGVMQIVRLAIAKTFSLDIESLSSDKYILIAECYKQLQSLDFDLLINLHKSYKESLQ